MTVDNPKHDLIMKKFEPITKGEVAEPASGDAAGPDSSPAVPGGTGQEKPDPRDQLRQSLSALSDRMRRNQTGWLANFGFLHLDERFRNLRDACQELQIALLALPDDTKSLLRFRSRIDDVEASYNRLRFRLVLVPSFIVIAAVLVAIGLAVFHSGLIDYVQDKMEIRRVMRFVLMAVVGAFLWGLTSLMSHRDSDSTKASKGVTFGSVFIRVLIAIVVPTILVMITFKKDGTPLKFGQIWKSPEAWSFLAGYSCQIIILGLNKLVEKVTKMIESV